MHQRFWRCIDDSTTRQHAGQAVSTVSSVFHQNRLADVIVQETNHTEQPFVFGPRAATSDDAAKIAKAIYETLDADKEHFSLLALNQKNRLIGYKHVSTGTLTAALVHPREVFTAALELRATALIFVHNHPSGDPLPSPEDIGKSPGLLAQLDRARSI